MKLNMHDFLKGLVVSFLAAFIMTMMTIIQDGNLKFDHIKTAAVAGLAAGLAYLTKNMFVSNEPEPVKPEPVKTETITKNLTRYEILKNGTHLS